MGPREIRDLRHGMGFSREELGKRFGVSASAVKTWEGGTSIPGPGNLEARERIAGMGQKEQGERQGRRKVPAAGRGSVTKTALSPRQILDIRKKAGLTQIGMADALGVSVNSVSNWETGSTGPHAKSLEKLLVMAK